MDGWMVWYGWGFWRLQNGFAQNKKRQTVTRVQASSVKRSKVLLSRGLGNFLFYFFIFYNYMCV